MREIKRRVEKEKAKEKEKEKRKIESGWVLGQAYAYRCKVSAATDGRERCR